MTIAGILLKSRLHLWSRSGAVLLVALVLGQSFCMAPILVCSTGNWSGSGARPRSEGKGRESRSNLRKIGSLALSCRVTLRSRTHESVRIQVAHGVAGAALLLRSITTCSGRSADARCWRILCRCWLRWCARSSASNPDSTLPRVAGIALSAIRKSIPNSHRLSKVLRPNDRPA